MRSSEMALSAHFCINQVSLIKSCLLVLCWHDDSLKYLILESATVNVAKMNAQQLCTKLSVFKATFPQWTSFGN